jgi:ArsR family transcriptional regulator, lead/cadmium/zinc/bismuth-responsive transcriptional repressor
MAIMPNLVSRDDYCDVQCVHPEAVAKAKESLPKEGDVLGASDLLKAIAEPTRMKILAALRAARELCVCDLSAVIGMSESATSHQLRLLRSVNLVTSRKEGRQVFYRLADAHVSSILNAALEHARE